MIHALFLLLVLQQDPAAAKFEIRVRPVQGDRLETSYSWTHTFRGELGDERLNFSTRGGRRLVVDMSRVVDGRLTLKGVEVADSYIETQDVKTGKYVRKDDAIHGRKVTIGLRDGREERTGVEGVPEAEQNTLTIDDPLTRLFPEIPVAIGQSWDFEGDGLKKIFAGGDFTEGRIVVSLRDVKEIDGRRCALLVTNYEVKGSSGGMTRELNLKGTLTVWLDRGYVLAMSQSGRMRTAGADPKSGQPNGEAVITGELKATLLEKKK
ncbi:MAG TPA: hypothetical protein VJU16_06730 [Planctomycetota bacterium]|nr:hypothetical protein [Planctomycetota bacterium]